MTPHNLAPRTIFATEDLPKDGFENEFVSCRCQGPSTNRQPISICVARVSLRRVEFCLLRPESCILPLVLTLRSVGLFNTTASEKNKDASTDVLRACCFSITRMISCVATVGGCISTDTMIRYHPAWYCYFPEQSRV